MFIDINTNTPDNNEEVLVKLSDGTITGALYLADSSDLQKNFFPIRVFSNVFSYPVVSWRGLNGL
jgi:hypothetical protein